LTSFFHFTCLWFSKKFQNFCLVVLYGSEILPKNSTKLWFFFKRNWDIWNPKFQQNSIVYNFVFIFLPFLAFYFLFHLSKTCLKIMEFLVVFYWKCKRFYQRFLKNSKSCLKKNIDMWNIFFQNSTVYYLFLYFFIFDILFSICSICTCFLFYGLQILSKKFWNLKFFINSIVYFFFLLF